MFGILERLPYLSVYSHLAMKQVQDAAKLLARRYDQSSLKTAAHISMIANDKQQGLMYTQKVVQQHLLQNEWKDTYSYLREQKGLQVKINQRSKPCAQSKVSAQSTGERLIQACPAKSVVRLTDRLDMTIAVVWDIKQQTKQTNDNQIRNIVTMVKIGLCIS